MRWYAVGPVRLANCHNIKSCRKKKRPSQRKITAQINCVSRCATVFPLALPVLGSVQALKTPYNLFSLATMYKYPCHKKSSVKACKAVKIKYHVRSRLVCYHYPRLQGVFFMPWQTIQVIQGYYLLFVQNIESQYYR